MRPMLKRASLLLLFACSSFAAGPDVSVLKNLAWREVGPFRGGRADAVVGIAGQRDVYYFGSCGGGVWKTLDGGPTWKAVSDRFFGGALRAVAVAPSRPPVVYPGAREETPRRQPSPGGGVSA